MAFQYLDALGVGLGHQSHFFWPEKPGHQVVLSLGDST
jgi:hypothetical protein